MRYDLVVRGGLVASHESSAFIELGIANGRIVAVGEDLGEGDEEVDARGW